MFGVSDNTRLLLCPQTTRMKMKMIYSNTPRRWPTSSEGMRFPFALQPWTVSGWWAKNRWNRKGILDAWSCFSPLALSMHQLAAQGEVSQVAARLSKGKQTSFTNCNLFLSSLKHRGYIFSDGLSPALSGRRLTAQQAGWTRLHSSHVGSSLWRESCGGLPLGKGRDKDTLCSTCQKHKMLQPLTEVDVIHYQGCRPQSHCQGARECPDFGQLWGLCGHCWVSSQTRSGH